MENKTTENGMKNINEQTEQKTKTKIEFTNLPSAVGSTIFSWVTVSLSLSVEKPSIWLLIFSATFGRSSNFGADIFIFFYLIDLVYFLKQK